MKSVVVQLILVLITAQSAFALNISQMREALDRVDTTNTSQLNSLLLDVSARATNDFLAEQQLAELKGLGTSLTALSKKLSQGHWIPSLVPLYSTDAQLVADLENKVDEATDALVEQLIAKLALSVDQTDTNTVLARKEEFKEMILKRDMLELPEVSIHFLPQEIGRLDSLTYIDLSNSPITALPTQIGQLVNLKTLLMRNTRIERLPNSLFKLRALKLLDLSGSPVAEQGYQTQWGRRELRYYFGNRVVLDIPLLFDEYNRENLYLFSRMIFVEGPRSTAYEPTNPASFNLIYNNDRFEKLIPSFVAPRQGQYQDNMVKHGKPLFLDQDTPIGYNIYLPKNGEVEAVLVNVYGGSDKGQISKYFYYPSVDSLNELFNRFLSKGIATISLNLVDLLDLQVYQLNMPENLHTRIHASINKFFEMLRNRPTYFHDDLNILLGKNIYLMGASFGGRTAVRHAELYPGTFSGYISHDGVLAWEVHEKSAPRLPGISPHYVEMSAEYLSPLTEYTSPQLVDPKIERIADPVLLLHNLDDNRVSVKESIHWYARAIDAGKKDLVRLHLTKMGNPISRKAVNLDIGLKGHFMPASLESFQDYMSTLETFILNGVNSIPECSEWVIQKSTFKVDEFGRNVSVEDRFLSHAYSYLRSNPSTRDVTTINDDDWNRLLPLLYGIDYLEFLREVEKMAGAELWHKRITTQVEHLRSRLHGHPDLATFLRNGLAYQLPSYVQFLRELGFATPVESVSQLASNSQLQSKYLDMLVGDIRKWSLNRRPLKYGKDVITKKEDIMNYMLLTLFRGNMDRIHEFIVPSYYESIVDSWKGKTEALRRKLNSILKMRAQSK